MPPSSRIALAVPGRSRSSSASRGSGIRSVRLHDVGQHPALRSVDPARTGGVVAGRAHGRRTFARMTVEAITTAHRIGSVVAGKAMMHANRRDQYHANVYRNALARLQVRPNCAISATGSPRLRRAEAYSTAALMPSSGAATRPLETSARAAHAVPGEAPHVRTI